jgi:hypothetical protein
LLALAVFLYGLGLLFFFDRVLLIFANVAPAHLDVLPRGSLLHDRLHGHLHLLHQERYHPLNPGKTKNSAIFFVGLIIIILGISSVGSLVQLYSVFQLFRYSLLIQILHPLHH